MEWGIRPFARCAVVGRGFPELLWHSEEDCEGIYGIMQYGHGVGVSFRTYFMNDGKECKLLRGLRRSSPSMVS